MRIPMVIILVLTIIMASCHQRVQSGKKTIPETGSDSISKTEIQKTMELDGVWSLQEISNNKIVLKELYPSRIPFLNINQAAQQISGNTSCNSFSGKIIIQGDKIKLEEPMSMTQRFCAGDGESTFLGMLQRVKNYKMTEASSLHLLSGDTLLMKFTKSTITQ